MTKIRWNGNGRRLALGYEWPWRGVIIEVDDPAAVATLLAQPGEQFRVIEAEDKETAPQSVKKLRLKQAQEE